MGYFPDLQVEVELEFDRSFDRSRPHVLRSPFDHQRCAASAQDSER